MTGAAGGMGADLEGLPAPVQRYFRAVLRDGGPLIKSAHLSQVGAFRSRETSDVEAGWRPFTATQVVTADPRGFAWDARIRMAPLLSVRVRDGYSDGRASMRGTVLGIVPMMSAADTPELRAGALQRYLAESVWVPTVLLPGKGMSWSAMDDSHARAALTDAGTTVALEFSFGPDGVIVSSHAPARPRAAPDGKGGFVMLPWGGRYRAYEERGGLRVPRESEAFWVVNGQEQPYYRGRILEITYSFGEPGYTDVADAGGSLPPAETRRSPRA